MNSLKINSLWIFLFSMLFIVHENIIAQNTDFSACKKCKGSGYYTEDKDCSTCDGHGHQSSEVSCKGCSGSGIVANSCGNCNGYGYRVVTGTQTEYRNEVQTCGGCSGAGGFRCTCCGGGGKVLVYGVWQYCNCCAGRGIVACSRCAGSGRVKVSMPYNVKTEKKQSCTRCGGDGEVNSKHSTCGGTGKTATDVNCSTCHGDGKITKRYACQHRELLLSKPSIVWDSPLKATSVTSASNFSIKACVNSISKITQSRIFINGEPYTERGITVESNCTQTISTKIPLTCGINKVYIEVANSAGTTTSSEKTINRIECADVKQDINQDQVVQVVDIPKITGKYHLLAIAVESYSDPGIPVLYNPIKDAQKLINVVEKGYTFDKSNITFLKNPKREDIINEFERLQKQLRANDNLLIFFAGHGKMQNSTGYWLPSDAALGSTSRWISSSALSDYIRDIPTKHTLVITDACFSGNLVLRTVDNNIQNKACEVLNKLISRRALTSNALAPTPDNSVFLQYILKKLQDSTQDCITDQELHSLIVKPVIANSPNQQTPQYGTIKETGDEGGCFIFYKRQ
jgi:Caspase domain